MQQGEKSLLNKEKRTLMVFATRVCSHVCVFDINENSVLTMKYHRKSSPSGRRFVTFSRLALNCKPIRWKGRETSVKTPRLLTIMLNRTYTELTIKMQKKINTTKAVRLYGIFWIFRKPTVTGSHSTAYLKARLSKAGANRTTIR